MNETQAPTTVPMIEMTAGEMLYNARTTGRRKREIQTIAKLLCIREEFLRALEEGDYKAIPETVYVLGFARSYAIELGLDPEEIITKIKKELGIIKEPKEKEESDNTKEVIISEKKSTFDKEFFAGMLKNTFGYVKTHKLLFGGVFASVVLVLILLFVCLQLKTNTKENIESVVAESTVVEITENSVKEPEFRYPVRDKFEGKNSKDSRVVLQAEKESWVKIEDARGNTIFSRVLIPGDVYYLPQGNNLKGTFGNVGAIDVWVDGQLVKKLGPANTRKTGISMDIESLKANGFVD